MADSYVQLEAQRNIAAKADAQAVRDLDALLSKVDISALQFTRHRRPPESERSQAAGVVQRVPSPMNTGASRYQIRTLRIRDQHKLIRI